MAETSTTVAFDHFAGFDWAKDHHDVVLLGRDGRVLDQWRFQDTAPGWSNFQQRVAAYPNLAVAIETSSGPAVERLLQLGVAVYPVQPKAAERYRERLAPSGVKTDALDAWSLADALRLDGHTWRQLHADDPLLQELRLLCRDEIGLIEQRTAFINQLQEALHEYYPAALEAFDDWTLPAAWAFVVRFATPQKLVKARRRKWEHFLHQHRLARPQTFERRLEIFARAGHFQGSPAVVAAKSRLALALAQQLLALEEQLVAYRQRIRELFAQHPDRELFGSLPGAGDKLAPRLLAECGDNRDRFASPDALRCFAGTAPVSFQSGQIHRVHFRRACNKYLRAAVHHWADLSRATCVWAQVYYQRKRDQGKSHACALRCLGQRWLKILWKMWQTHTPYNEAVHTLNQTQHGSWVIGLLPCQ